MRVTIPTTGSRGDVQPYVALGVGLRARGHEVCLATHADFESLVRGHGLDFFMLAEGGRTLQASDTGDRMLHSGDNAFAFLSEFARLRRPLISQSLNRCWLACRGSDLILATNTEFLLAEAVAERERLPVVWTSLQPVAPSRFRPSCLFRPWPRGVPGASAYNLGTHAVTGLGLWLLQGLALNRARRDVLGLPPVSFARTARSFLAPRLCLDGYSARVVPPPPDWDESHQVTGFWYLDSDPDWKPPPGLIDFLAAGPPPICVGFGSMHDRHADRMTKVVIEALKRSGQRGVMLSGWGGLGPGPASDSLFTVASVPHAWLFPQVAATVHHGGAGTTAACLRAGVPSLVVPFMADQPFWGRCVFALGVGPKPIPHGRLGAENLAQSIRIMVTDAVMRQRAAEVGAQIRAEDGVGRAVDILEQHFQPGGAPTGAGRRRSPPSILSRN